MCLRDSIFYVCFSCCNKEWLLRFCISILFYNSWPVLIKNTSGHHFLLSFYSATSVPSSSTRLPERYPFTFHKNTPTLYQLPRLVPQHTWATSFPDNRHRAMVSPANVATVKMGAWPLTHRPPSQHHRPAFSSCTEHNNSQWKWMPRW